MAGPLLGWDKQTSRRRWAIVAAVLTFVLLLFTATSHYRPARPYNLKPPSPPQPLNHPPQSAGHVSPTDPAKTVSVPQFTKPEGISIVGYIFFGRKSRVEILRCYVEVRLSSVAAA